VDEADVVEEMNDVAVCTLYTVVWHEVFNIGSRSITSRVIQYEWLASSYLIDIIEYG